MANGFSSCSFPMEMALNNESQLLLGASPGGRLKKILEKKAQARKASRSANLQPQKSAEGAPKLWPKEASGANAVCCTRFPEQQLQQVTVKNTFVHMRVENDHPVRRASSLPPSMRLKVVAQRERDTSSPDKATELDTEQWADDSTELCGMSEDYGDTDSEASGCQIASSQVSSNTCTTTVDRTPLRSQAAAWTSNKASFALAPPMIGPLPNKNGPLPGPGDLLQQIVAIVSAATAALAGSGLVMELEHGRVAVGAREERDGWTVVAQVRQEDLQHRERLLAVAKQALLQAAEASGNIYVLGYLAKPFQATSTGFSTTLGVMADQSQACWGSFSKGFCRCGESCRWQHPTCRTSLAVVIEVPEPLNKNLVPNVP